jgi:hypothetical protein
MTAFNRETGPRPSKTAYRKAAYLARAWSGDHLAIAMAMRPCGATQAEIIALLGKPHRNKLKALVKSGAVKTTVLSSRKRPARIRIALR